MHTVSILGVCVYMVLILGVCVCAHSVDIGSVCVHTVLILEGYICVDIRSECACVGIENVCGSIVSIMCQQRTHKCADDNVCFWMFCGVVLICLSLHWTRMYSVNRCGKMQQPLSPTWREAERQASPHTQPSQFPWVHPSACIYSPLNSTHPHPSASTCPLTGTRVNKCCFSPILLRSVMENPRAGSEPQIDSPFHLTGRLSP